MDRHCRSFLQLTDLLYNGRCLSLCECRSNTAGAATIVTNSAGVTFFTGTSTGGQARFITNSGAILDISELSSGGIYQLGSKTLTVGLNNLSTEVSGTISDGGFGNGTGGALIKVGTGTLTLTGPNTYTGGTSFNGGIVAVNSDSNLGTGPLSFNGGTLEVLVAGGGIISNKPITLNSGGGTFSADTGTTSILNGLITGPGSLTMTGRGTVTLTGANIYSGGTNINGENVQNNFIGIVAVNSNSNLGTGPISFDGGTLEVLATGGGITSNKVIALSPSGGTFQADAGTTSTLSGAISGQGSLSSSSGTLRKSGPATLILSGANTYGGVTVVQGGTLKAGSSTAF